MYVSKPLYPAPWWSPCVRPAPPQCDGFSPDDEYVVKFVGVDCDGNALFCVKRKQSCREPRPCPYPQPRYR